MKIIVFYFFFVNLFNLVAASVIKKQNSMPYECLGPQPMDALNTSDVEYLFYEHSVHGHYSEYQNMLHSMFKEVKNANSERKMCPFEWKENVQENRFPKILLTAVCQNKIIHKSDKDEKDYKCEPVTYILPVLRVQAFHYGLRVYKQCWENITISCIPKRMNNFKFLAPPGFVVSTLTTDHSIINSTNQSSSSINFPSSVLRRKTETIENSSTESSADYDKLPTSHNLTENSKFPPPNSVASSSITDRKDQNSNKQPRLLDNILTREAEKDNSSVSQTTSQPYSTFAHID